MHLRHLCDSCLVLTSSKLMLLDHIDHQTADWSVLTSFEESNTMKFSTDCQCFGDEEATSSCVVLLSNSEKTQVFAIVDRQRPYYLESATFKVLALSRMDEASHWQPGSSSSSGTFNWQNLPSLPSDETIIASAFSYAQRWECKYCGTDLLVSLDCFSVE